jgi:hypothetical protein
VKSNLNNENRSRIIRKCRNFSFVGFHKNCLMNIKPFVGLYFVMFSPVESFGNNLKWVLNLMQYNYQSEEEFKQIYDRVMEDSLREDTV